MNKAVRFYCKNSREQLGQGSAIIVIGQELLRKAVTNLDSILKSRDITLPKKVLPVKAMVFPVVMYGYESWVIEKSEH